MTDTITSAKPGAFAPGQRILHDKFGPGVVVEAAANKLTVEFDQAGRKRVVACFVRAAVPKDDQP
jgi:DNA helicase-2/ATP-dependent DNA helicase PcrA